MRKSEKNASTYDAVSLLRLANELRNDYDTTSAGRLTCQRRESSTALVVADSF